MKTTRTCLNCGDAFTPKRLRSRYCSSKCGWANSGSRGRNLRGIAMTCQGCASSFLVFKPYLKETRKFCSRPCEIANRGPRKSLQDRLFTHVSPEPNSGCWLWTGYLGTHGYGTAHDGIRTTQAHRATYRAWRGDIPPRTPLDHLCRVPACVNPDHLEVVSHRTNFLRGMSPPAVAIRDGRCRFGHPYTEENTYYRANGNRQCRICTRRRYAEAREAAEVAAL